MQLLAPRTVFFVRDAPASLDHYTRSLGFTLDWVHEEHGRAFVFQVSLLGLQLILNQTETHTQVRAGHGRVFVGVDSDQVAALRAHLRAYRVATEALQWGAETEAFRDPDGNEFFFWFPKEG